MIFINSLLDFQIMKVYSRLLMKKPVKYTIFVTSLLLTGMGVLGTFHIDQRFDKVELCAPESPYVKFYNYFNTAFPTGDETSIVLDQYVDYTNIQIQRQYSSLDQVCTENKHMKDFSINWMTSLRHWAHQTRTNISGHQFLPSLHSFLRKHPYFYPDLVFDKNGNISASRMICYLKDETDSHFQKNAMLTLRLDLRTSNSLPVYAITYAFIFYEQYAVILRTTIRNIAICATAILIITLPYLINPKVTFAVFVGFVSLMFELFGIMYLWNVSLNAISMIILVMGIGFSVDYSAHIAHAFVKSEKKTTELRVREALETMGSSVAMGGMKFFFFILIYIFYSFLKREDI